LRRGTAIYGTAVAEFPLDSQHIDIELKIANLLCAACFTFGALMMLFFVSLPELGFIRGRELEPGSAQNGLDPGHQRETISACGKIEPIAIPFANPDGVFPDRNERLQRPKWFFQGFSASALSQFLNSCELRPAEKKLLLDKKFWNVSSNGCWITPSEKVVYSLSPQSRQRIYSVLAKAPANYPQYFAFSFPLNSFDAKFKESGLPGEQLEKIRRLTYTNAGQLCFADLQVAETLLKPSEFNDLVQTLCAVPAYMLRLHITPESDIDALVKYWGKGGREKLIAPLLSSMARVPGGTALNISYLLPPFARLRLYTYPDAWDDPTALRQDCIFTSLNFFNATPDTNYLDQACRERVLNSDYAMINDDPCFGDLITVVGADDHVVHVCVYIADGFVFTKNGASHAQPWVLMKMPDMLMVYNALEKSRRILFLRHKEMG
jgi:hypothetical protein